MKSPSVSCLDVDSSPPTNDPIPSALTPSTPIKSHRRSVSCGNNPTNNNKGSGPDMRIVRIRMDLQDGNMYRSILVLSWDNDILSWDLIRDICLFLVSNYTLHYTLHSWLFTLIHKYPLMLVIQNISSGCTQDIITRSQAVWYHCRSPSLFPQVTSNDKTPTVISSALEKHSQDPKQAPRYELIQLLPEGKGKDISQPDYAKSL